MRQPDAAFSPNWAQPQARRISIPITRVFLQAGGSTDGGNLTLHCSTTRRIEAILALSYFAPTTQRWDRGCRRSLG